MLTNALKIAALIVAAIAVIAFWYPTPSGGVADRLGGLFGGG